jgi:hypothetical protein
VHIRVDHGITTATVMGVVHRYPRAVRVPLTVASHFAAAGTPVTVERADRTTRQR